MGTINDIVNLKIKEFILELYDMGGRYSGHPDKLWSEKQWAQILKKIECYGRYQDNKACNFGLADFCRELRKTKIFAGD